jgi:uncharacterized integral membrane protein (TIGR00698 family)
MNKKGYFTVNLSKFIVLFAAALCLFPFISSGLALFLGLLCALLVGNPYASLTKALSPKLLQASVIGLGAGMNLEVVARVGVQGIAYTASGIILTLVVGLALGRLLAIRKEVSLLVSMGTAICGGSAIAAVASTIHSKSSETSLALAIVFFLNALALFIFPQLGQYFQLSEQQFGLWSALAIHDTSSVVGAALAFGGKAVEIATTVKLARALWIIPCCLAIGVFYRRSAEEETAALKKTAKPWFILGFLLLAALVTWVPASAAAGQLVYAAAKRTLVFTLFLIGANLSRESLSQVGWRPLLQGMLLWALVASGTLLAIQVGWIA